MTRSQRPGANLHDPEKFAREFTEELRYGQGVDYARATPTDLYMALARTVRQAMISRWIQTLETQMGRGSKAVVYLSAEYLLGRQLDNALTATNLRATARHALASLDLDLDDLRESEVEPGLGNGGLGRLAACFLDSLATMQIPAVGYGIRYEYGIFQQQFNEEGRQHEVPDSWLRMGNPWEFPHPEMAAEVGFGGTVTRSGERAVWEPATKVLAVPYNYMVPGYRSDAVNTLRLWRAQAPERLDLQTFNSGDFQAAVAAQTEAESISKVLYPEDSTPAGKRLRLQQQYFFVAASIHDFIHNVLPADFDLRRLHERVVFQLNDTHPVIAIPELMRVLIDENGLQWDEAWRVTKRCFGYTCHTLLPEALEVWPVDLIEDLLPRHMEIIYRINSLFLAEVAEQFPGNDWRVRRMSIIEEHPVRSVRMAFLAAVGSSKVNGVAELHSRLLRERVLPDFAEMYPDRFTNVTNGVTPRRFLKLANPELSALITYKIGPEWVTDLERLRDLDQYAEDEEFLEAIRRIKHENKLRFADTLRRREGTTDLTLDVNTMFDAMVKRLHEYKRQMLKLLHVVVLHQRIIDGHEIVPRTVIFGAKAAPGYAMAKEIIGLINAVGRTIDRDPRVAGRLKVVFPPNYNVTLAETLIPAADLSEQISLAGKEASGTGNMKFALNGALTIGTLDGANVEIRELVGPDNFFLCGMTEQEAHALRESGYAPWTYYEADPMLRRALDALSHGDYSEGRTFAFGHVVDSLLQDDPYMVLADFASYIAEQDEVDKVWAEPNRWDTMVVHNIARSGFFSSDRAIRDYLDRIWHVPAVPVP